MLSQKPRPKRVSPAAAEAFETLVHQEFPQIDEKGWRASIDNDTPTIIEFGQYWFKALNSDRGKAILAQLPGIVEKNPVAEEGQSQQRSGVTYIKDKKTFKGNLKASVDPGPIVIWNDLPVSKF